jgi:RHS repeat-associated protein
MLINTMPSPITKGSLTTLTDQDGNIKERQAFDPWGNRRDPDKWTKLITTPVSHITGRGYTMHEHLDDFALINMNGRVYVPQIARFLSPDPQLQAPGNWLNYNRYTYCFNNPLIYYDPTGRKTWFGKFFNWVGEGVDNATDWFWDTTYQFGSYLNDKGINVNINAGYNTSQNFFIEGGNYRYYLNQGKANPAANVNKEIYNAREIEAFLKGNTPSLPELATNEGGFDSDLAIKTATTTTGAILDNMDYIHYLPKSNRLKIYNRPYVNQYTKNTKITGWRGTAVLFLINEGIEIKNLANGSLTQDQFYTNTGMNVLGSINPMYGITFFTYDVLNVTENAWNQYNSKPNALRQFYNNMNSAFEEWRKSMNGGF